MRRSRGRCRQAGFSLVEMLTAGSILAVAIMGVVAFLNKSNELDTESLWRAQAIRSLKFVMGQNEFRRAQYRLTGAAPPPYVLSDNLPAISNFGCDFRPPPGYTAPVCAITATRDYINPNLGEQFQTLARITFTASWSGQQISLVKYYSALHD